MITVFVLSNAAIVLAYVALGFYVAPRFSIFGAPVGVAITKYAMLAFFLFCAFTHVELIIHVLSEPAEKVGWLLSWHMIVNHILQAIAAPIAAVFTGRYLQVTFGAPS